MPWLDNMWFDIPNPWLGIRLRLVLHLVDSTRAIFGRFSYNFIYHYPFLKKRKKERKENFVLEPRAHDVFPVFV